MLKLYLITLVVTPVALLLTASSFPTNSPFAFLGGEGGTFTDQLNEIFFQPSDHSTLHPTDRDIGNDVLVDCGSDADILHLDYIHLNPAQPLRGQSIHVEASGTLSEPVVNGTTVDVLVKMGVVQILKKTFDVCEEIQKVDRSCPVPEGEVKFERDIEIPNEVPPGKFYVQARVYTPDRRQVACLKGVVVIRI